MYFQFYPILQKYPDPKLGLDILVYLTMILVPPVGPDFSALVHHGVDC